MLRRIRTTGDAGASAVEYGILVFAVAASIVLVVIALGGYVEGLFDSTCDQIAASSSPSECV